MDSKSLRKVRVLVIDDDPIVLEVIRERLEGAGYDVMVREHALGTVQVVREEQPDIVLLDVMMPALNGERIATLLKGSVRTKDVGIVLYSSKSEAELAPMINETGALGAISKSERADSFLERFDALVKRHVKPDRLSPLPR
ncbi:MAG TPA: response regulator [Polyangiales bacterium]|nr:response regulator [Polyangiales bacterium]